VLFVELVEQVDLKDGAPTGICWHLVDEAATAQNVLTSRTAASMKAQYYIVVANLKRTSSRHFLLSFTESGRFLVHRHIPLLPRPLLRQKMAQRGISCARR
jgi:hypothetical protein